MGASSVTTLTTAESGAGKSYVRCAVFMAKEFLPETEGVHYSNFPVYREVMAQVVADKTGKDYQKLLDRIQIIPKEVLDSWADEKSGPWEYFKGKDLDGAHIAIDEIHNFCGKQTSREVKRAWGRWLGELRHQGATFEGLTQAEMKLATEIKNEAGTRYGLVRAATRRDPWFKILVGDWYELRGSIFGDYRAAVLMIEKRQVDEKWKTEHTWVYRLEPEYFKLYDSFSAPHQGGEKKKSKHLREFEKRSRAGLWAWFLRRNGFNLSWRFAVVAVVIWICFLGGGGWMFNGFMSKVNAMATSKQSPEVDKQKPEPAKVDPATKSIPAKIQNQPGRIETRSVDPVRDQAKMVADTKGKAKADKALAAAKKENEELKQRVIENAKKEEERSELVLVMRDSVTFRDGTSYKLDEVIEYGIHKGRTLSNIDYRRRRITLLLDGNSDVVVALGRVRRSGGSDAVGKSPGVRPDLQPVGKDGKAVETRIPR